MDANLVGDSAFMKNTWVPQFSSQAQRKDWKQRPNILPFLLHLFCALHALYAQLMLASSAATRAVLRWDRVAVWAALSRPPKFSVSGGDRQWQTCSLPHKPTSVRLWSDQVSLWLP